MMRLARFAAFAVGGVLLCAGLPRCAHAQCQLTIDPLPPLQASVLTVSGTAVDCGRVTVQLSCAQTGPEHAVDVVGEVWSTQFSGVELKLPDCSCGGRVAVRVSCAEEGVVCDPVDHKQLLACEGTECPTVRLSADQPQCDERAPDGTWPVSFVVGADDGAFTGSYTFVYGDGVAETLLPTTSVHTHAYTCPYSAPDYSVSVVATGCAGNPNYTSTDTVAVDFPACACPPVRPITTDINGCTANFTTSVGSCDASVVQFVWNFGDGSGNATDLPTAQHTYGNNGTFDVTVTLVGAGDNCVQTGSARITQCEGEPPNGPSRRPSCGIFDWCCWLVALWIGLYIALALLLYFNQFNYASLVVAIALVVAFLLWVWICDPTRCDILQYLFIATSWVIAIFGGLAMAGITGNAVVAGAYGFLLTLVLTTLLLLGDCSVPNPVDFGEMFGGS